MYSCESVVNSLRKNKDIEFDQPEPTCPKHADTVCAGIAGKCPTGNAKHCEQKLTLYFNGAHQYILYFKFVYTTGTRTGFIRETDLQLCRLIRNNALAVDQLITLA